MKLTRVQIVLAGAVALWGFVLFGRFSHRALDIADPRTLMYDAQDARQYWLEGDIGGWIKSVCGGRFAMPVSKAALSIGTKPIDGSLQDVARHFKTAGFFTLLTFAFFLLFVFKQFGEESALFCAALWLSSNIVLGFSLNGGHNWAGQAFFWLALASLPKFKEKLSSRRAFVFGALLALSPLSSYHLLPVAGSALGVWIGACYWREKKIQPWIFAAAGFALPFILVSLPGLSNISFSYLGQLWANVYKTQGEASRYPTGGEYLFRFLFDNENILFLAAFLPALLWGAWRLKRKETLFILAVPVLVLPFLEMSGNLKLGRMYIPLFPVFFLCASLGLLEAYKLWGKNRRWILPALVVFLFLSNAFARENTRKAFYAGDEIRSVLKEQGVGQDEFLRVVGLQLPYAYYQGQEQRVYKTEDLPLMIQDADDWVLMSFYSSWWGGAFMEDSLNSFVPIHRIMASTAPYLEVSGIESSRFTPYMNEGFYYLIRSGRIPFPFKNRLYKARDILPYLQP